MDTMTTDGIKVSVENKYRPDYSHPLASRYVFSYRIIIENQSAGTVQLMRRHWFIQDASGKLKEVEGEGVIGKQPILAPGESHEYSSWCQLATPFGRMYGTYLMVRKPIDQPFEVKIPEFRPVAPYLLN